MEFFKNRYVYGYTEFTSCQIIGGIVDSAGNIFTLDYKSPNRIITKFDSSYNALWSSFFIPAGTVGETIFTLSKDELFLYLTNNDGFANTIYQIDTSTGSVTKSFTA